MKIITGIDERTGEQFNSLDSKRTRVDPDPTNNDSTDYPRKGCRQCGRRDRPQYRGVCNDDSCPTLPDPAAELAALRERVRVLREACKHAVEWIDATPVANMPRGWGWVNDELHDALAATEPTP